MVLFFIVSERDRRHPPFRTKFRGELSWLSASSPPRSCSRKPRLRPHPPTVRKPNEGAIERLEAALEQTPGDPALLINLGTAYAREGRMDEARDAFRDAIAAQDRYRVQLPDGSWEDSRKVARLALDSLDRTALAAK